MSVEEALRQTLAERADDVAGSPTLGRAGRARARAREMQVRRAVAAAVAALVAVAVGIGSSGLLRTDPPPDPAPRPERAIDVVDAFAGRTLITSAQSHDGEPLFVHIPEVSGTQWLVTCAGLSPEYLVHRAFEDAMEETAPCGPLEVMGESMDFRWSSEATGAGELALWITRDGVAVQPEGAILAVAGYALPDPVANLGRTDVAPLEAALGEEWAYLDSVESQPGDRRLTTTYPAEDEEMVLELLTDPPGTDAEVELLVDGVPVGDPRTFPLGSSNIGDRLNAREPHTVTLRIVGDVPPDALLGIVRRTLAGDE